MRLRLQLILALIVGLFAGPAFAQEGLDLLGVDNGAVVAAGGSFTGILDVYATSAKAVYSLRAASAAIAATGTQKAINVTNSVTTEICDVLIATSGDLGGVKSCSIATPDGTPVATFCSTNCLVNTWYDQTSNHYDAIGTGSTRPTLTFSCIGSFACLTFDGVGNFMGVSATATAQPLSISTVAKRTGNATTQNDILVGSNGFFFGTTSGTAGAYFGGVGGLGSLAVAENVWHAMEAAFTSAASGTMTFNADGSSTGSATGVGTNTIDANYALGSTYGGGGQYMTGQMFEVVLYASDFSASAGAICHNQNIYLSLSKAC